MDAILIKSRYKVTQVLYVEQDYAALLAVDIESRDKSEYLLNVYEGALAKRYAGVYSSFKHCPEYVSMFLADSALVAVFKYKRAQDIDDVFFKGAAIDWKTRLQYAQLLFHLALSVSDFPPELACAAFLARNQKILSNDMKLFINYIASPIEGAGSRELIFLLTDSIRKVLIRRFYMSRLERNLIAQIESGALASVTTIYSAWQEAYDKLTKEYEKVWGKSALSRFMHFAKSRIGGGMKR